MKILILNFEFPPVGGGAANANLCLLRQYAGNNDLQIDVLTSAPKPGFVKEKFADNIIIYKVGIHKRNLQFWRKSEVIEWLVKAGPHYKKLVRENDYKLAHAFFGFPTGWLCYRNAEKLPYIISLRGSDVPGDNARLQLDYKILSPVFRAIWKKAAGLIACSEGLKRRAQNFMPSAKIDVIPNGVELDKYFPAPVKPQSDELKLITAGRLSSTKRIEMLIETVGILRKQGHKLRLNIAGSGSLEQSLKQLISQKKLDYCIEMSGRVEPAGMSDLYRNSDIYISATMQEGMSNSMLEAMASGLPIITTRCEGLDELIKDNGVVIDNANPADLAASIKNIIGNTVRFQQMAAAARKQAERFSWRSVAEKYIDYYRSIIP
ncbi:MAG: glycosyltransferase family 4 protein [Sedimentisphaerales bacterium]|nr:glycosyltransferase family 4 protein [Sedimentisphaerales bacterium]